METKSITIYEMINEIKAFMSNTEKLAKIAEGSNNITEYEEAIYTYQSSAQMLYELQIESLSGSKA